jgi:hypothetical protein
MQQRLVVTIGFLVWWASASVLAAPSMKLMVELPGWEAVTEGATFDEVALVAREHARPRRHGCRSPEVFFRPGMTVQEAVPTYLGVLPTGLREHVLLDDEDERLATIDGLMFELLVLVVRRDDAVWLVVC